MTAKNKLKKNIEYLTECLKAFKKKLFKKERNYIYKLK